MKNRLTTISRICILALAVASFSFAGMAMAQDSPAAKSSSLSVKDKTFMKKAAKGGMMEGRDGNIGLAERSKR